MINLINAMIFSPVQLVVIILLSVVLVGFVVLDVVFGVTLRLKAERKLYDDDLQSRREALLNKLEYIRAGGTAETHTWLDFVQYEENEDDADDEENETEQSTVRFVEAPTCDGVSAEKWQAPLNTEILCVDELSPQLRRKLAMRAKRHNGKMFYVRYSLGFEARLCYADDETKVRYMELMDYIKSFEGVSVINGFASQRICVDKNTIAMILFSGKKMCVSLALDPSIYKNTKYRGEDKSDTKRFAKTPMFVRIYSDVKLDKIKYLIDELAKKNNLQQGEIKQGVYDLSERTREEMILSGNVRVIIVQDVPDFVARQILAEKQASGSTAVNAVNFDEEVDDDNDTEVRDDAEEATVLAEVETDEKSDEFAAVNQSAKIADDNTQTMQDDAAATVTEK